MEVLTYLFGTLIGIVLFFIAVAIGDKITGGYYNGKDNKY